jgi:hypothetical protein
MRPCLLASLFVVACNGPSPQTTGGAGSAEAPPVRRAAPPMALDGVHGTITLTQAQLNGYVTSSVGAMFASASAAAGSSACVVESVGPCKLVACPDDTPGFGSAYSIPRALIHTSSLRIDGAKRLVLLNPLPGQNYAFGNFNQALWSGGETLTVVGGGDAIPAFRASVTAPSSVVLSNPVPDATTHAIVASAGSDLALKWAGGGAGQLQVKIANQSKVATCTFAARDTAAIVPAQALAFVGAANHAQFSTSVLSSSDTNTDGVVVTVNATVNPTFAGGATAASQLVIQ